MGIKLSPRVPSYKFESKTQNLFFTQGKEYHDVPPDIEKFLVNTGNFFYVKTKNQPVPLNIQKADENRRLMEQGIIDGKGNLRKKSKAAEPTVVQEEPAVVEREIILELDDDGNERVTTSKKKVEPKRVGRPVKRGITRPKNPIDELSSIVG